MTVFWKRAEKGKICRTLSFDSLIDNSTFDMAWSCKEAELLNERKSNLTKPHSSVFHIYENKYPLSDAS